MFNVENALCAIACTEAVGMPHQQSIAALRTFPGIPGRMERIDEGQPFSVFVDFTVTPEAYRKTLQAIRAMLTEGKRLLVLTGSGGDRMREKRPEIGKIVSECADVTVVTNEDPYTEDPEHIIAEVWAGIDHTKTKAHRIVDRKEAIAFLFKEAQPGDIVLLCGKGSDTTMWTRNGQIPWNEREIVRAILRKLQH
jgi:UDP-N-acetylmuramoyl-L-alanyl-D-glutamate--2,6-diaminopimelate ligase